VEAVIHFEDDTVELQQWDQQVIPSHDYKFHGNLTIARFLFNLFHALGIAL
jgi:hypothetical protein